MHFSFLKGKLRYTYGIKALNTNFLSFLFLKPFGGYCIALIFQTMIFRSGMDWYKRHQCAKIRKFE